MTELFLRGMYYICSILCMVCTGEWLFHWTTKKRWKIVTSVLLFAIVGGIGLLYGKNSFLSFTLLYTGELLAGVLLTEGKVVRRLVRWLLLFFGLGFLEAILKGVWEPMLGNAIPGNPEVLSLCCILLVFVFSGFFSHTKLLAHVTEIDFSMWKSGLILGVFFFGTGIATFVREEALMIAQQQQMRWLCILFVLEMLVVSGVMLWLFAECYRRNALSEQAKLKDEILQTQQEYCNVLLEKDRQLRRFRHDIGNQFELLTQLLEQGKVARAQDQLRSMHTDFRRSAMPRVSVGDEMLDVILNMAYQKAAMQNVELVVYGRLQSHKELDGYELCTIFLNAIDNGIRACTQSGENATLTIRLLEHNRTLFVAFENPATEDMYQNLQSESTSKEDKGNHGFGVESIRRAVGRMQGSMEYRYENGKVILEIYI